MPPGKAGERPAPTFYSDAAGTTKAAGLDLASGKDKVRNWLACQAPVVSGTTDTTDTTLMADAMALGKVLPAGKASVGATFDSIYDTLTPQCASCHSVNGAYKQLAIDFSTKDNAYATLVSKPAVNGNGGMCTGRTLVKPMDCANSLLWQKLKYPMGAPELCGAPMPFGAPMLSADIVQAVCDWINAGAMK